MLKISFASSSYLFLLLLIPLIIFLRLRFYKPATILFSSLSFFDRYKAESSLSSKSLNLPFLPLLLLILFILALARPQFQKGQYYMDSSGIDILLALDISGSMLALDLSPSPNDHVTRIDTVKQVVQEFIRKRKNDRIGIIAFAGNPYLVSPMTLNHDWLLQNLDRLRVGLVPDGTAIGSAITMGVNRLKDLQSKSKLIILLTDGSNNAGKVSPTAAAEIAAALHTKVYTIAIGKSGKVPTYYMDPSGQLITNIYGSPDIAIAEFPVDDSTLEQIASITNAKSFRATTPKDLEKVYDAIDKLEKSNVKLKVDASSIELFPYLICLSLFILSLHCILSHTKFQSLP